MDNSHVHPVFQPILNSIFPNVMKEKIKPVDGAAMYEAIGNEVWMTDTEGWQNCIDEKPTNEAAEKCAQKWQEKENKAVLKSKNTDNEK
jgi:hypothetical protein